MSEEALSSHSPLSVLHVQNGNGGKEGDYSVCDGAKDERTEPDEDDSPCRPSGRKKRLPNGQVKASIKCKHQ